MGKQLGRAMLVAIGDGQQPTEAFNNLVGLNSKSFSINNNVIDVTTPDATTPGGVLWKESLGGLKSIQVDGDGYFRDSAAELRANTVAMAADPVVNMEITIPDFGTFAGAFRITRMEYGGESEGGVTYGLSLESSGAITFTAI